MVNSLILLCWLPLFIVHAIHIAIKRTLQNMLKDHNIKLAEEHAPRVHAVAMMMSQVMGTGTKKPKETETSLITMDSDSFEMRVDTGASHCISYDIRDFIGKVTPTRGSIQGYHEVGRNNRLHLGTMRFRITDDEGRNHTFDVPNSIFDEQGQHKLLCPQHWSRDCDTIDKAYEMTGEQSTVLAWMQKSTKKWHYKTVQHSHSKAPVPVLHTSPGYSNYNAYCTKICPGDDVCCYSTRLLKDDLMNQVSPSRMQLGENKGLTTAQGPAELSSDEQGTYAPKDVADAQQIMTQDAQLRPTPLPMEFQSIQVSDDTPHILEDEETNFRDDQQQLLHWHHRLGHMPFTRLKEAAEVGIIPRRLRNVPSPRCTACMYAKATKKPWRTRAPPTSQAVPSVNAPGAVVSVDQLESSTPGFIGQLKGWLTRQRYTCATVFVDQYSDLTFVYLQRSTNAEETLDAKEAFERYAY